MSHVIQHDELGERLGAYAGAALRPDAAAMARVRASLVAAARLQYPDGAAETTAARPAPSRFARAWLFGRLLRGNAPLAAAPGVGARPVGGQPRQIRRVGFAFAVCCLVLAMSAGAVAASGAGGPLYGARLWVERAALPASGSDRAQHEIPMLESRLSEIRDAATRGDAGAVVAAIGAYEETATDAVSNAGANRADLDAVLTKHVAVLESLLRTTGEKSSQAIENAIEKARQTIDRIEGGAPGAKPSDAGRPSDAGEPDASPTGSSTATPGDGSTKPGGGAATETPAEHRTTPAHPTPKVEPTPAEHPTPPPHPTPPAHPTPKADATPAEGASAHPHPTPRGRPTKD